MGVGETEWRVNVSTPLFTSSVVLADLCTHSYVYVQDSSEYAPSQLPLPICSRACCPCDPSTIKLSLRHFFAHHVPSMRANYIV